MPIEAPLVGIVGATGAVGLELLSILAERGYPAERVLATASGRSIGDRLPFGATDSVFVQAAEPEALGQADVVILASSSEVARSLAPDLVRRGCRVVDNSSAFRQDPDVPLVVPEVNLAELGPESKLVANPNCSTILLLVALEPLRRSFGVEQVVVSTYQAVSGAGRAAMDELRDQTLEVLSGREAQPSVFPEPCAFNVFPHESTLDPATGLCGEEQKIIQETHRIWGATAARVIPTCARVPVVRSHCQSVTVTLTRAATEQELRHAIGLADGVSVLDGAGQGGSPTSLAATGANDVLVGRLRRAPGAPERPSEKTRTFCLWLAGDQLRKGAALNAWQIAEHMLRAEALAPQ